MSRARANVTWESDSASISIFEDSERQVMIIARLKKTPNADDPIGRLDKPWKKDFILSLRKGQSITRSAELAGVTPRHAWRTYKCDPIFASAWDRSLIHRL